MAEKVSLQQLEGPFGPISFCRFEDTIWFDTASVFGLFGMEVDSSSGGFVIQNVRSSNRKILPVAGGDRLCVNMFGMSDLLVAMSDSGRGKELADWILRTFVATGDLSGSGGAAPAVTDAALYHAVDVLESLFGGDNLKELKQTIKANRKVDKNTYTVDLFIKDIIPQCKWDLLPFSFLYAVYSGWSRAGHEIPIGRNQFISQIVGAAKDGRIPGWTSRGTQHFIRPGDRMTAYEPLTAVYHLDAEDFMGRQAYAGLQRV